MLHYNINIQKQYYKKVHIIICNTYMNLHEIIVD